tara:strand:+ start:168 stop:947 length:780 start_codon:yes stop_codon:yes gene_type:complete
MTIHNYTSVTELSGELISNEQLLRMHNRYMWASTFSKNADVLELACGTGPGLGLLSKFSKSLIGCDIDPKILSMAKTNYNHNIDLRCEDISKLKYKDNSFDLIVIFEAVYYLPDVDVFFKECFRTLRPGGYLLISNANKDLENFNPSPHSFTYHGVVELNELLNKLSFECSFFGYLSLMSVSFRQKLLAPLKKIAIFLGLMPKTMWGKKFLKRFVFGRLVLMPAQLYGNEFHYDEPTPIPKDLPDKFHKVIYCAAKKPL